MARTPFLSVHAPWLIRPSSTTFLNREHAPLLLEFATTLLKRLHSPSGYPYAMFFLGRIKSSIRLRTGRRATLSDYAERILPSKGSPKTNPLDECCHTLVGSEKIHRKSPSRNPSAIFQEEFSPAHRRQSQQKILAKRVPFHAPSRHITTYHPRQSCFMTECPSATGQSYLRLPNLLSQTYRPPAFTKGM